MKHVIRARRLVRVVFDETINRTDPVSSSDPRPTVSWCTVRFRELNKKYDAKMARMIFAIATGDGYLDYDDSRDPRVYEKRVLIKSDGLKLLTSPTFLINELAGTIGSVAPIIISIIALVVSVAVAVLK